MHVSGNGNTAIGLELTMTPLCDMMQRNQVLAARNEYVLTTPFTCQMSDI